MTGYIALAADHAGFLLKTELVPWLVSEGHEILDLGPISLDPDDDYPDFAEAVAGAVTSGQAYRGILVCGSGVGACVAANKVPGVRSCLCHDTYSAHQGVEHDDINVLCLGGKDRRHRAGKGAGDSLSQCQLHWRGTPPEALGEG